MPYVIVYHDTLGCDTGCCGHRVQLADDSFRIVKTSDMNFFHPHDEDLRSWAESLIRAELGEEHVRDLDWENCIISTS
jgi:hypothetical protein